MQPTLISQLSWLPQFRKWSGKTQEISLRVKENLSLWKKSGEEWQLKGTFVHFTDMNCVVLHGRIFLVKLNNKLMLGFWKIILFACYLHIKELAISVHCTWLAESTNKWVEGIAVRGALSEISETSGWGNHDCYVILFLFFIICQLKNGIAKVLFQEGGGICCHNFRIWSFNSFCCPLILWLKVWLVYSRIQAEMVLIPSALHVDGQGDSYPPFEVNRYPICFFTFQSKNCTGSFFVLVLMSCRHSHFMPVMTNLETGGTKQQRLGYSLCTCM